MGARRPVGWVWALLLAAGPAQANIFDTFGAGARSQGMAGAVTALTADHFAAFHNPAGLADAPPGIGLGATGLFDRTAIRLKARPDGYDPPRYSLLRPRADTEDPSGVGGMMLGFALKLFSDDLVLGGAVLLPFEGFGHADTRYADEREQAFSNRLRFELVGERQRTEVLSFGLGYRLLDWLSMGVGILVMPQNTTTTQVYTPNAADPGNVDLNLKIEQSARWALTAGLVAEPVTGLRFGVAFQDEMYFSVGGQNRVTIRGESEGDPVLQPLDFVAGYSPPRFSFSVATVDLWGPSGLKAAVEGTWRGWSRYLDNHGAQTDFENTVEWKLGLEYGMSPATRLRAGTAWVPTPVPLQDGRSNYVDNDRVVFSLGAGRDFEVAGEAITVDLGLQLHALLGAEVDKRVAADGQYPACGPGVTGLCDELADTDGGLFIDPRATEGLQTGNPGFPGYVHGGYLVVTSLDVTWRF